MASRSATILFVDDDVPSRELHSWLFRDQGYLVLEAGAGCEALEMAPRYRPDLIVLDVNLPDMTGFEVCRRLRQDRAHWPSILHLSAVYVGANHRAAGLEGGADAYLTKPVEPRELLATACALLRVRTAESAARRAAQQWRSTFDAISDSVCLLDVDGVICRCNRAMCELLRLGFDKLVGRPLTDAVRAGLGVEAPGLGDLTDGKGREVALAGRWLRAVCDPVGSEPDSGRVLVLTDLTRHKELEDQLRRGQRLEAIGRLAGGIAHDFNNLLTSILGNATLLLRSLPSEETEHSLAASIERTAWRAADLTRQLLGFSQQALLWLQAVAPEKLLGDVAQSLTKPVNVTVTVERGEEPTWTIQADPVLLTQALLALCANSFDAMPHGGQLTLRCVNRWLGEPDLAHIDARPGEFVCISIEDTGKGIPHEVQQLIFDPFFTTKPFGEGRGLGLAMVHGIAKQHRGWVQCESALGHGTRFDLYFPRAHQA